MDGGLWRIVLHTRLYTRIIAILLRKRICIHIRPIEIGVLSRILFARL